MNFADVTLASANGRLWAHAPGLQIGLPEALAKRANGHNGAKATVGVRPEDIHVAGPADPAELCFDAEVEVVEQLGSEILLDTRVGEATFVASVDPTLRMRVHDRLKLAISPPVSLVRRPDRSGDLSPFPLVGQSGRPQPRS